MLTFVLAPQSVMERLPSGAVVDPRLKPSMCKLTEGHSHSIQVAMGVCLGATSLVVLTHNWSRLANRPLVLLCYYCFYKCMLATLSAVTLWLPVKARAFPCTL